MVKKLVCLILTLALVMTCFSTSFAAEEKSKLKVITSLYGVDQFPFPVIDKILSEANVEVEWEIVPPMEWGNRKTVVLNQSELPDVFLGMGLTDGEVCSGSFVDLVPYLEKMPNVVKFFETIPDAEYRATTVDGKIFGIPNYASLRPESGDTLYVNKAWCDTLGIELPKTTEEFHQMLLRFKNEDPNGNNIADEIGITGYGQTYAGGDLLTSAGILGWAFPAFGVLFSNNDSYCMVKDGALEFQPATDNYRKALEWLNELFVDGLIDPEFFTLGPMQVMSKLRSDPLTVGAGSGWSNATFTGDNSVYYETIAPLIGPDGYQYWDSSSYSFTTASNKACISTSCKDVDAAVRLINAVYDEWNSLQLTYGSEGVTFGLDENGNPYFLETPEGYTDDEWLQMNGMNTAGPGWCSKEYQATITGEHSVFDKMKDDEFYAPYYDVESRMPYLVFTEEQLEELALLKTDVKGIVQQNLATFVVNGITDESWNAYVQQLNAMGLEDLMAIYTTAYQSYLNK